MKKSYVYSLCAQNAKQIADNGIDLVDWKIGLTSTVACRLRGVKYSACCKAG